MGSHLGIVRPVARMVYVQIIDSFLPYQPAVDVASGGRVVAVHVGRTAPLRIGERVVSSGIVKRRVVGAVFVGRTGLRGDEQGNREHHGGLDKAVCAYPAEHYAYWSKRLGLSLGPGAFGENFTLKDIVESSVCVGDVVRVGDVFLQVSQPRPPCFRLAAHLGVRQLALWVQQLGLTGFYMRVLSSGFVRGEMDALIVERPNPDVTIAEVNRVLYSERDDVAGLDRVLQSLGLADRLRVKLVARLDGHPGFSGARLYGR